MKKIFAIFAILALVVTGCSSNSANTKQEEITITHTLGETKVTTNPKKVVIYDMGILDTYNTLELEVAGLPKSNIPAPLSSYDDAKYTDTGTLFEPNYDNLATLAPDLIIVSGRISSHYDELSKVAPTISLDLDATNYTASVIKNLETLKLIYPGKADAIAKEITALNKEVSDLKEKASKLTGKALFMMVSGDSLSVYGSGSRFGMVYDDFGFTPIQTVIEASNHGQQITFEYLAQENPDYIFVMDRGAVVGGVEDAKVLLNNDFINSTTAAKNNHIIYLDAFVWYLMTGGLSATNTMVNELSVIVD